MKLGEHLNSEYYWNWRFVDADLYDIAERVRQYDPMARLVREDESGQLGIARLMSSDFMPDIADTWMVARRLVYPGTGEPWTGEPDARVLEVQRRSDSFRITDRVKWRQFEEANLRAEQLARHKRRLEANGSFSEEFVFRVGRDSGRGKGHHIYVPRAVAEKG